MFLSGPISARIAQEASPRAAGTRNAIAGRVVDKAGRPVPGVFVTLLHDDVHWNGVPRVSIVRAGLGVRTDADGAYRLENLPLGSVYVVALPENPPVGADGRLNRAGHGITYYPSTSTRAEARQVTVTMIGPVVADITMLPATLAAISGTVIGQDGKPVGGGTLGLAHGDGMFGVHTLGMSIRSDGAFVLAALPPGTISCSFAKDWCARPLAPPRRSQARRWLSMNGTSPEFAWRLSTGSAAPVASSSTPKRESSWRRRPFMSAHFRQLTACRGRWALRR